MTFQHYWNVGLPNIFMKNIDLFYFLPASFPVRRVHWLHAHAQQMRWQEEVTITTYEMQWTVHYFIYKSNFWSEIQNAPATDGLTLEVNGNALGMDVGSLSYAKQKHLTWYQFALKADKTFKVINNAYKSPFLMYI